MYIWKCDVIFWLLFFDWMVIEFVFDDYILEVIFNNYYLKKFNINKWIYVCLIK